MAVFIFVFRVAQSSVVTAPCWTNKLCAKVIACCQHANLINGSLEAFQLAAVMKLGHLLFAVQSKVRFNKTRFNKQFNLMRTLQQTK